MAAVGLAIAATGCSDPPGPAPAPPADTTATATAGEVDPLWAVTMAGPGANNEFDGVATGADGSVFVTGRFTGSTTVAGTTLRSAGAADIPVARIDADGAVMWVRSFGGPGEDNLFDIDANDTVAVGTGIISGTVGFDDITVTSNGGTDCVVVALDNDGGVRWVTVLGGPGDDGCNEVAVTDNGSVVTSLDTTGGWDSPAGPLPVSTSRDTLLVRLDPQGSVQWARAITGAGPQRGKALAVADDGTIAFGGDTIGPMRTGNAVIAPVGTRRHGWLSRWTADGELLWWQIWDGPATSQVKGLATDGAEVTAVGAFGATVDVGGTTLDAGSGDDLAVVRYASDGTVRWTTAVTADADLTGAEIISAADGGVLFGGVAMPGLQFKQVAGPPLRPTSGAVGSAWLVHIGPDGSVVAVASVVGSVAARPGELDRSGSRLFVDMVLRGDDNSVGGRPLRVVGKGASVWAVEFDT